MVADRRLEPEAFLPLTHLSYHILLALTDTELHGYGIIKEIERRTGGGMRPETGTLYTAIRRLREEGLIESVGSAGKGGGGRRGKAYSVTELGQAVLKAESRRLERLVEVARQKRVLGDTEALETPR